MSVQFTVDEKHAAPDALDALGTAPVPESITIDGVAVPTDVLERRYAPAFRVVAEPVTVERKVRIDPVVPGVSVGNVHVSAGTIGGIVYDRADGTPYVLSNWHVLQGSRRDRRRRRAARAARRQPRRAQPAGPARPLAPGHRGGLRHRDHRGPRFDPAVIELGVVPAELGEPELDDTVVKSGRTTGVTHGIVRRVDAIVQLDYGGPWDPEHRLLRDRPRPRPPGARDEISRGGDSGTLWLFTKAGGDRDGHGRAALRRRGRRRLRTNTRWPACPLRSSRSSDLAAPPAAEARPRPLRPATTRDFLASRSRSPRWPGPGDDVASTSTASSRPIHPLLADHERARAGWRAGWRGTSTATPSRRSAARGRLPARPAARRPTPRSARSCTPDNHLDRGHLARRADLVWGTLDGPSRPTATPSSSPTSRRRWTTSTRARGDGVWGRLEDAVFEPARTRAPEVSVFGGPVLADDDRVYRGVLVPARVLEGDRLVRDGALSARAFLLTQDLDPLEALDLDEFATYQVPLADLAARTGVLLDPVLASGEASGAEAVAAHVAHLGGGHRLVRLRPATARRR